MPRAKKPANTASTKNSSPRAKKAAPVVEVAAASTKEKEPAVGYSESLDERIRRRAYEISLERGVNGGNPQEDWLRAEAEIRSSRTV